MSNLLQLRVLLSIMLLWCALSWAGLGFPEQNASPETAVHQMTISETKQPSENSLEQLKVLELSEDGFDWGRDWWKYTIMALAGALVLFLALHTMRLILRLLVTMACVAVGMVVAKACGPALGNWCAPLLPDAITLHASAEHVGYVLGFLLGYLLVSIVASLLLRPLNKSKKKR
ncbi:MAG: CvpA family protein [Victivallales bacterium]|nr:CvpA family protein [Victivallales bacterium]